MSKYFRNFPTVGHNITNVGSNVQLTNILRRFKFRSSVQDNVNIFYTYNIQEGDRADTIAEKYYGDSGYAWIVLHFNDIIDPVYDWPLFYPNFEKYIRGKYGSMSTAQSTVHEYRQIIQPQQTRNDGSIIPERYVVIDQTTYVSLGGAGNPNLEEISDYDYEVEENERKRQISILDKRYLSQVRDEVEQILRNL